MDIRKHRFMVAISTTSKFIRSKKDKQRSRNYLNRTLQKDLQKGP